MISMKVDRSMHRWSHVDDRLHVVGHPPALSGGDGDPELPVVVPVLEGNVLQMTDPELLEEGHHFHGGTGDGRSRPGPRVPSGMARIRGTSCWRMVRCTTWIRSGSAT